MITTPSGDRPDHAHVEQRCTMCWQWCHHHRAYVDARISVVYQISDSDAVDARETDSLAAMIVHTHSRSYYDVAAACKLFCCTTEHNLEVSSRGTHNFNSKLSLVLLLELYCKFHRPVQTQRRTTTEH
jgi:hypothetical protein